MNNKEIIKKYEEYTEYENTNTNKYMGVSSFYMLSNGTFLNCEAYDGIRGDDHRIILGALDLNDFDDLHDIYNIIRVVPECNMLLIKEGQEITEEQQESINLYLNDFEIELY